MFPQGQVCGVRLVVEGDGVFGFVVNAVVVELVAFGGDAGGDVGFSGMPFDPLIGNGAR